MDITVPFPLFADHPELDAQVPAEVPLGQGKRHPAAALLHVQDVRLQGDRLHRRDRLPKREGHPTQDRPQPLRQRLPGVGRRKVAEKVSGIKRNREGKGFHARFETVKHGSCSLL